jgi:hypothetical protein
MANKILQSFAPLIMSVFMTAFAGAVEPKSLPGVNYLVAFIITYPSILAICYLIVLKENLRCPRPLKTACVALGAIHGSVFVVGTAIMFAYAGKHTYQECEDTVRAVVAFGVPPIQMLYCVMHLSVMDTTKGEQSCQQSS